MSRVYHNIWLGGLEEGYDERWLNIHQISHILNVSKELNVAFQRKYGRYYKHLPMLVDSNFDI